MKISGFDNLGGVVGNQLIMFLWGFFYEKALYIHVVTLQLTAFPLNWITSCKHLYIGIYINCLKHFFLYFQQNLSASIISINTSPFSQEIHLSLFFLPVTCFYISMKEVNLPFLSAFFIMSSTCALVGFWPRALSMEPSSSTDMVPSLFLSNISKHSISSTQKDKEKESAAANPSFQQIISRAYTALV